MNQFSVSSSPVECYAICGAGVVQAHCGHYKCFETSNRQSFCAISNRPAAILTRIFLGPNSFAGANVSASIAAFVAE